MFPFEGWITSQQVAAAISKGEFDIAANSPCRNPCNCASTSSLSLGYLLKVNSLSIQSTACFLECKQGPKRCAGRKDLRVKPQKALHGLQATLWLLASMQGSASFFQQRLLAPVAGVKGYCCLWFRKKEQ